MNDDINDIAPAANAEPVVTEAVVVAEPVAALDVLAGDVLAGEAVAGPELGVAASKPKGKVGRPRKVATPDAAPLQSREGQGAQGKSSEEGRDHRGSGYCGNPSGFRAQPGQDHSGPQGSENTRQGTSCQGNSLQKADVVIKTRKTAAASPGLRHPRRRTF